MKMTFKFKDVPNKNFNSELPEGPDNLKMLPKAPITLEDITVIEIQYVRNMIFVAFNTPDNAQSRAEFELSGLEDSITIPIKPEPAPVKTDSAKTDSTESKTESNKHESGKSEGKHKAA